VNGYGVINTNATTAAGSDTKVVFSMVICHCADYRIVKDEFEYEYDSPQALDSSNYDESQTPDTYNYGVSPSKSLVQGFAGLGLTTEYQPSIFGPVSGDCFFASYHLHSL
jgi:hypothetical protein